MQLAMLLFTCVTLLFCTVLCTQCVQFLSLPALFPLAKVCANVAFTLSRSLLLATDSKVGAWHWIGL